jgi:hypothetical protein
MKTSLQAFLLFVPGFATSGFLVQAEGHSGVHSHDSHLHFLALWISNHGLRSRSGEIRVEIFTNSCRYSTGIDFAGKFDFQLILMFCSSFQEFVRYA